MKKLVLLLSIAIISFFLFKTYLKPKQVSIITPNNAPTTSTIQTPTKNIENSSTYSLFIPYWKTSLLNDKISIPRIADMTDEEIKPIYFGLSVDENGLMKDEIGFKNLPQFISNFDSKPMAITIRMLNDDTNIKILKNQDYQNNAIESLDRFLTDYSFSEIILDLELKSLPTEEVINQINQFVKKVADKTHQHNLIFSMTIYGDVFYRQRPFDIQKLSSWTDRFYIMTYDFHKSYGLPGPNFPLEKNENDNYDMKLLIDDLLRFTSSEKIVVVFGLYGYDWTVDEKGRPLKSAKAITLNQIHDKFLNDCPYKSCVIERDNHSSESHITYIDEQGKKHDLWFEDEKSIAQKISFLKSKNISSYSFWTFGYF